MLGIPSDVVVFDVDVRININSALMALNQLGIGPYEGLFVEDDTTLWSDLLGERKDLEAVKTYIYLKTRLGFDPPANSFLVSSFKEQITELEWRLNVQAERTVEP
jgi:hypothetical protein